MKFRKKPVVVDAEQWLPENKDVRGICRCISENKETGVRDDTPHVHTIHAGQRVDIAPGDWIIAEPDTVHFYPCRADIFEATYEKLEALG
jgi:hypothetical protein